MAADPLAAILGSCGMRAILDDRDPPVVCDFVNLVEIGRIPAVVHNDDRARSVGELLPYCLRAEIAGFRMTSANTGVSPS